MSKHNNNLFQSLERRCYCGRYISLGELKAGIGVFNYTCPDCVYRQNVEKYFAHVNIILYICRINPVKKRNNAT